MAQPRYQLAVTVEGRWRVACVHTRPARVKWGLAIEWDAFLFFERVFLPFVIPLQPFLIVTDIPMIGF